MTTSPRSGSEHARSSSFDLLHHKVQRWVWAQGWPELRDAQERAIPEITAADRDVIIAAATASGKTEAAFLPICSTLLQHEEKAGVRALYVSPLKALINDQHRRLDELCEHLGVPVHRWHGDVASAGKAKVLARPDGILLITPESLEALFVLRGLEIARVFAGLDWVVVDEMHSFIGTPRGAQLQSLMHRLELSLRRKVPRVGLSATLSDMGGAAEFLRPGSGNSVTVVESNDDRGELRLQVRGYLDDSVPTNEQEDDAAESSLAIAQHLFTTLRGKNHLVFVNRRGEAERYADRLRLMSEKVNVPNEFFPHHGNLAKDVREHVEQQLKSTRPTTAICTSTLEMGIDIGSVASVAQIGAPPTVSGLRQRLGRSGRRGEAAVLRMYVAEPEITADTPPSDQLRAELFQTVAMVDLLLERWYEPPDSSSLHLSTLIQQVLSIIAQQQGAQPVQIWRVLCQGGPFAHVDQRMFGDVLRDLGRAELIQQEPDGLMLLGRVGEGIVNHYSFYAAFATSEEYRMVSGSRTLGTIPILHPVLPGQMMIFAGRRWQVRVVDDRAKLIELSLAGGGRAPLFAGTPAQISDVVRRRMRTWYESDEVPAYLDATARRLLEEGRSSYRRLELGTVPALAWGDDTVLFPWLGDRLLDTLAVWLTTAGFQTGRDGVALTISHCTPAQLGRAIWEMLDSGVPSGLELAAAVPNTTVEKYDPYLGDALRHLAYSHGHLDIARAAEVLSELQETLPSADLDPIAGRPVPDAAGVEGMPFAVVDVETTGFAARRRDRIVEIAVIRLAQDGTVQGEWSSLVNPERGPGATSVHGLRGEDLRGAPRFADIAVLVAEQLDGAVLVGHNLPFDRGFLDAEFSRAGKKFGGGPSLCTMQIDEYVHRSGRRSLRDCCRAVGVGDFEQDGRQHSALADARTTARLLRHYIHAGQTVIPVISV
ncbi:DEAD/DEAH box helicase [Lentzea sp. NBC_00516]|uniref:DEAD/DEAH box helicase n=1 Tax=Lentzea sp. NBC_00516 TaxID=2903582 RepID=UPI002E8216DD|nr:DEAD/DEAH box helicase [Lentzea sp. NBC_00516]WUD25695.1 DEAD/DEAH box helicase [Lentzea sp. NBC_00516]